MEMTRIFIAVGAILTLISFDIRLQFLGFQHVCAWIQRWPIGDQRASSGALGRLGTIEWIVGRICLYYPKRVLCFERSAVLTRLIRRNGLPTRLVIGAERLPFYMHAWVEVDVGNAKKAIGLPVSQHQLAVLLVL